MVALSRFIARSSNKCHKFFKILKEKTIFEWTDECEETFGELKSYLKSPPLLVKPNLGDVLQLYLAVSSVLVKFKKKEQKPIFYTRKVLLVAETRCSRMKKLIYAIVVSAHKRRPYFKSHAIEMTAYCLRVVLSKQDLAKWMALWATELGSFDIKYVPRTVMKS